MNDEIGMRIALALEKIARTLSPDKEVPQIDAKELAEKEWRVLNGEK